MIIESPQKSDNDTKACDDLKSLLQRLRPFQRDGFEFVTKGRKEGKCGRALLADEMGLGYVP